MRAETFGQQIRRLADLVRVLGRREFRVRYRQSVLEVGWVVVVPAVTLAVYGYVLTRSFSVQASCGPYLVSAWIGLVVWTFWASTIGSAVTSLVSSGALITKVHFPTEAMPLAVVWAHLIDLAVGLVTIAVLLVTHGVMPTVHYVAIIGPLVVLLVWTSAIAVLLSVVAALLRDVIQLVGLVLRVGIFATPVLFEGTSLPAAMQWTTTFNPVALVIEQTRLVLLCATWPQWDRLVAHLVVGSLALIGSVAFARAKADRVSDVV